MIVDFATGLTNPYTSRHPFYGFVYEHPPEGVEFRLDASSPRPVNRAYADRFCETCSAQGPALDSFVHVKSSLPDSDAPVIVPTYPEYLGPRKQFVWVEDWTTLLSPWVLNGRTGNWDMEKDPRVPVLRHWASRPEFGGVITHMHGTVEDVERLLCTDKVFYVPLALPMPEVRRERTGAVRFLFTNSFGGQPINMRLRGFNEVVQAFKALRKRGLRVDISVVDRAVDDDELDELYRTHDVFLIPGCRIHSVAVARAMAWGMPVVCSDGWGYSQYVENGVNGLVAKGQWGVTTWTGEDGMLREDYASMPALNGTLVENLVKKMSKLADVNLLETLSRNARKYAERYFDVGRRNRMLSAILGRGI